MVHLCKSGPPREGPSLCGGKQDGEEWVPKGQRRGLCESMLWRERPQAHLFTQPRSLCMDNG
jgi:hypothetical protein